MCTNGIRQTIKPKFKTGLWTTAKSVDSPSSNRMLYNIRYSEKLSYHLFQSQSNFNY